MQEKERILNNYRAGHGQMEIFFEAVKEAIEPIQPMPMHRIKKSKSTSTCAAVKQISDGHLGAVQDPMEIEGFNAFNYSICRNRQLNYSERFVRWIETMRNAYSIPACHVLVTGDMISGDIHHELQVTNEFPAPVQCVRAGMLLAEQVSLIAPYFHEVTVEFVSEDNHGRLTKKPQAKEAGTNSFNYVVGEIAKAYLRDIKNVEFNIYPMLEKVVKVMNRQYLITHGGNVRGWMGIPWYGIQRQIGKEAMSRMEIIMNEVRRMDEIGFHKYVFGHFHTPFDSPTYSCCGAVSGTDAYDHQSGRHADPSQSSWLVHPKYGDFNRINFNLKYITQ